MHKLTYTEQYRERLAVQDSADAQTADDADKLASLFDITTGTILGRRVA